MGTRYRYFTPDGGPPNSGAPPGAPTGSAPAPGSFPPFGAPPAGPPPAFCCGAGGAPAAPPSYVCHPVGAPKPPAAPPFWCPAPGPPPAGPPFFSGGPPPAPPPGPRSIWVGAPPAPPAPIPTWMGQPVSGGPRYDDAPPPGARVKGLLPKFPDGSTGYIFPKSNCTFQIVIGSNKPWDGRGEALQFQVMHAPTSMRLAEFIEQIGAVGRAPPGTPPDQIGICEIVEAGNGAWRKGSAYYFGDGPHKMSQTLDQLGWGDDRGEAGRHKPVTICVLP